MNDDDTLIFDIEADGLLDTISKVWCIGIQPVGGRAELYGPDRLGEAFHRLCGAKRIIAHNAIGYDIPALAKCGFELPASVEVLDSLLLSRLVFPQEKSHSIKAIGLRMGVPKAEYDGGFEEYSEEMGRYCLQDVNVLHSYFRSHLASYLRQYPDTVDLEHRIAKVLFEQERGGFRFLAHDAWSHEATLRQELHDIEQELQEVFPPIVTERYSDKTGKRLKDGVEVFNPGSRQQIAKRLQALGWKPSEFTPNGSPKIDDEILSPLLGTHPFIEPLVRYFRVQKIAGQLAGYAQAAAADGNVHGRVNTLGTRTRRMSHYDPNLGNVDKALRQYFVADETELLVGVDADGLELRCLAHYLYPFDGGELARAVDEGNKDLGTDMHTLWQKASGMRTRDGQKTLTYGFIYGAGDVKLGRIYAEDHGQTGLKQSELLKMGKHVRATLEANVTGLAKLVEKVKGRHGDKKEAWFVSLDRAPLWSPSSHSALNTLLQSSGAIIMKKAQVIHATHPEYLKGWRFVATVHDEWQHSVQPHLAQIVKEHAIHSITKAGVELGFKCPLRANGEVGLSWKDTH